METNAVFIGVMQEKEISKKETADFLQLYEQSVLLSLREQGIIQ